MEITNMPKVKLDPTEKRDNAIILARDLLQTPNLVILDTETTGMTKEDVVIELAVINTNSDVPLANLFLQHEQPINPFAQKVHGITKSMTTKHGLPYDKVHYELVDMLEPATIMAYNMSFDSRLLTQTAATAGIYFEFGDLVWVDLMPIAQGYHGKKIALQKFCNEYQIKANAQHRALADCYDTLNALKFIAGAPTSYENPAYV